LPVVRCPGQPAASIRSAPECTADVVAGQARPFGQNRRTRRRRGRDRCAHTLYRGRLGNPLYRWLYRGLPQWVNWRVLVAPTEKALFPTGSAPSRCPNPRWQRGPRSGWLWSAIISLQWRCICRMAPPDVYILQGLSGRGDAGSCKRTSENSPSTRSGE
jgi:hypothetical protein